MTGLRASSSSPRTGEEVAAQVKELTDWLAGRTRRVRIPGPGCRLFTARAVARKIILPEGVRPDSESAASEDLDDVLG